MFVRNINVFLPNFITNYAKTDLRGHLTHHADGLINFYVLDCVNGDVDDSHFNLFGEIYNPHSTEHLTEYKNYLSIEIKPDITIKHIKINGEALNIHTIKDTTTILIYDYKSFLNSEDLILSNSDCDLNQFKILKKLIDDSKRKKSVSEQPHEGSTNKYGIFGLFGHLFEYLSTYSNLFHHICVVFGYLSWIVSSVKKSHKISIKTGNLITALMIDLFAGIVILHWINAWAPTLISKLFELVYIIIPSLQKLLEWLMGSPAGLKLNHAFNTILGRFFLYHIDLWWMFLEISRYPLEMAIEIFQYLGMLGVSFQCAIITDLLSLATFHVYCIYIYAARLYNVQLSGLIALWRLFLGRKYNPLRDRVDSCSYNHHQLFIGTLGFTILLFLLPTTVMYYFVFATFRISLLLLNGLLKWIQYLIQSFPLHLLASWMLRSQKIAGDIHISAMDGDVTRRPLILLVKLNVGSIVRLIGMYKPDPIADPPEIKYREIISMVSRGNVLNVE